MFADTYAGGAELTTEALLDGSPHPTDKIQSNNVTIETIQSNPGIFWIFGNFTNLSQEVKLYFIKNEEYSIVEYDYKYCKYRNPSFHELKLQANEQCECENYTQGKLNLLFFTHAKVIWWMSQEQRNIYINKFPFLNKVRNVVLSSVFSKHTQEKLSLMSCEKKNEKWIILDSPSWVKNREGSVKYALENNLDYELVWGLEYEDLLEKLATSKGLIFLPIGKDTCPRLVIEAKALGCELVLNENVQHKNEDWFKDEHSILEHLHTRTEVFWKEISKHV